jgi:hypothetical protein
LSFVNENDEIEGGFFIVFRINVIIATEVSGISKRFVGEILPKDREILRNKIHFRTYFVK